MIAILLTNLFQRGIEYGKFMGMGSMNITPAPPRADVDPLPLGQTVKA